MFQVRPRSTTVLTLTSGVTLTVKTHLNAGETRKTFKRMYTTGATGETVLDPLLVGTSKILGYLLDWTGIASVDGSPIVIPKTDAREAFLAGALDAMDPEDYSAILKAIEAHDDAMAAARAAEKNARDGGTNTSATSPSPSEPAGPSSMSAV
jgi:hypothetical protein